MEPWGTSTFKSGTCMWNLVEHELLCKNPSFSSCWGKNSELNNNPADAKIRKHRNSPATVRPRSYLRYFALFVWPLQCKLAGGLVWIDESVSSTCRHDVTIPDLGHKLPFIA